MKKSTDSLGSSLDQELLHKLKAIGEKNLRKRVEFLFFFIKDRIAKDNKGYASFGNQCFSNEEMELLKGFFNIEITGKKLICFKLHRIN